MSIRNLNFQALSYSFGFELSDTSCISEAVRIYVIMLLWYMSAEFDDNFMFLCDKISKTVILYYITAPGLKKLFWRNSNFKSMNEYDTGKETEGS